MIDAERPRQRVQGKQVKIGNHALRSGGADADRSKSRRDGPSVMSAGGVFRGSKRTCTERARWRLVRGQTAQKLSVHYQLDCDYGTSTLGIYNDGDAVFLCEGHVSAIQGPRDNAIAGVRPVEIVDSSMADRFTPRANAASGDACQQAARMAEATLGPPACAGNEFALTAGDEQTAAPRVLAEACGADDADAEVLNPAAQSEHSKQIQLSLKLPPTEQASFCAPALESDENIPVAQTEEQQAARTPTDFVVDTALGADTSVDSKRREDADDVAPTSAVQDFASAVPVVERSAAVSLRRAAAVSLPRVTARDLAFGNSAKALVDETIWNMATGDRIAYWNSLRQGKTPAEAAQAAGGQLAVIHRKVAEYTAKIEAMLSESKASINVSEAIDRPLEQATLEIIGNGAIDEATKDSAVSHLGALQEHLHRGVGQDVSSLQAHRIARLIGDAANWGCDSSLPEILMPAYRAVFGNVRDVVRAAVPEARELDERLCNLFAAKSEIQVTPAPNVLHALPA